MIPERNILRAGYPPTGAFVPTGQLWELVPWECGRRYRTKEAIRVEWHGRTLTVPAGFIHDRYTWAPDLPDSRPCIAHDFACEMKEWDDGTPLPRYDANRMFLDLMKASPDKKTRAWSKPYFFGVEVHRVFRKLLGRD